MTTTADKTQNDSVPAASPPTAKPARSTFEVSLRWVGALTAVISLGMGAFSAIKLISDVRDRARNIEELSATASEQQQNGDFAAAWSSLEQALAKAAEGGQLAKLAGHLDRTQEDLRIAQENLAMMWLRKARLSNGETFTQFTAKFMPVLTRGLLGAAGTRKADLLAHLGWSVFLKGRESGETSDAQRYYERALRIDPGNPFAHAHLGHLILWQHGSLATARDHFTAGLATDREHAYVRTVQLAALSNLQVDDAEAEFVRVVNDMRKGNEPVEERARTELYSRYYFALTRRDGLQGITTVVPAIEQIATIEALLRTPWLDAGKVDVRDACIATLHEYAGQRDEALALWRTVRARLPKDAAGSLVALTNAAIKRLSRPNAKSSGT